MESSMKISLAFNDVHKEENYLRSKVGFQFRSFFFVFALLMLQTAELYFVVPKNKEFSENLQELLLIIAMPTVILILMLVSWKFRSNSSKTTPVAFLFIAISSAEYLHQNSFGIRFPQWIYLMIGMNTQIMILFLLLTKISWIHTVITTAAASTYTWVRLLNNAESSQKIPNLAVVLFCLQIFFILSFSYFFEKEDRRAFLNADCQSIQMITFEQIMKDAIPSSIIIMRKDKALFYNNFTKKNFDITNNTQILDILHKMRVLRKSGFYEENEVVKEKEEINSFTLYELYKDSENYSNDMKDSLSPGFSSVEGEMSGYLEDSTRSFSIQLGPAFWKNELGILIIINDISHIKSYYKTLNDYKDNLLATVSHDLRAPLNGILGMLSLLYEEIEEESKREKLNISIVSAKLLQNMINDILDFSLISKGKLRLKYETTNVSALVEETAKALSLQAKLKGLIFQVEDSINCKEENHIIDGNRLRQVLFNLIGNAIKFTSKGKIVVRVREESLEKPDFLQLSTSNSKNLYMMDEIKEDIVLESTKKLTSFDIAGRMMNSSMQITRRRLVFEVEDTGVGIKPDDIGKLFKLFSRVTAGHDNQMNGIGLGLAISQSLVMMMNNGRKGAVIRVESTFGKGSLFKFPIYMENEPSEFFKEVLDEKYKLPVFYQTKTLEKKNEYGALPTHIETLNLASEGDSLIIENKKAELLFVDDDQLNLLVASKYLKSSEDHYSYEMAHNGEEAVNIICDHAMNGFHFDVIFMDCNMPIMNGYEASRTLKLLMKEQKIPWTPIVALTANNLESDNKKCLEAGMDLVLCKPYMKNDLLKIINDALKMKNQMV